MKTHKTTFSDQQTDTTTKHKQNTSNVTKQNTRAKHFFQ